MQTSRRPEGHSPAVRDLLLSEPPRAARRSFVVHASLCSLRRVVARSPTSPKTFRQVAHLRAAVGRSM
ncbi:MAG: hypothetical protein C0483_15335 [Pirellula sp.]|nr:hypothetical protein [Pirellula sp.]